MNYREVTLLAQSDPGTEGTKVIDINVQDPISRIDIEYRVKLADNAMIAALGANVTKIELVDGSDVLFSMKGLEAQALNIYDRRVPTMNDSNLTNGNYAKALFGIDFGRRLWDEQLAFDPTKFRNPQLKITTDCNLCSDSATLNTLEAWVHCFDEKVISPIGFLMAKEHQSWTPSAAGKYEYIDLPLDYPFRQMLIRAFLTQVHPDGVLAGARLSEDHDKRIPFDINLSDYLSRMKCIWLPVEDNCFEYVNAAGQYDKYLTPTTYDSIWSGMSWGAFNTMVDTYLPGGWLRLYTSGGTPMHGGSLRGWCPNHTFQIPFGKQEDLDDWYDVTTKGNVRLRLYSGASAGATSVISTILQQLRRY